MNKKKGTAIATGIIIAGLIGSNAYAFVELNKEKNANKEKAEYLQSKEEQLDVAVTQLMNKSSQYASHEDMIYAFNTYSASNSIRYKDNVYYADLKHVNAHSFNEKEEVKYTAEAEMTFLKDKVKNEMSYIQNELPLKVMEEGKKIVEESTSEEHHHEESGHDHDHDHDHEEHTDSIIPDEKLTDIEKKLKEEFVVHEWKDALSFNMDGQYIMQPTAEMEENLIKEFIKSIVLKDKGFTGKNAEIKIDNLETIQLISVKADGQSFEFKYNKDTKEFTEQ